MAGGVTSFPKSSWLFDNQCISFENPPIGKNLKIKYMNYLKLGIVAICAGAVGLFAFYDQANQNIGTNTVELGESAYNGYVISEAAVAGNLQVFMISGTDSLNTKQYTTLAAAMEKNMVKVNETGSVNELAIDNSSDEYIFIHSGDIVKGGKQDRTMAYDMIIPPHTKNVALPSFCVESGRWQGRQNEDVSQFSTSENMLSSRDLKMAAKYDNDQSKVWQNVSTEQEKLNANVTKMNGSDAQVVSNVSATSLQLTLESEALKKARTEIENTLKNLLQENPEAIGYAYAINGEIYGVDLYNNRALFTEIWDKIVTSIVVEAISNQKDGDFEPATLTDLKAFMDAVTDSNASTSSRALNKTTNFETTENETGNVVFSTMDNETNQWLHKNYMKANKADQNRDINQLPDNILRLNLNDN